MILFDGERTDLTSLKYEKFVVFIKMASLIEESFDIDFLSPEGVADYLRDFNNLKDRLNKLWIVLKPSETVEVIKELNKVEAIKINKTTFLTRAIEILETDKSLFLCQDDKPPLVEALFDIKKYW
jgi:hypothetical protein